VSECHVDIRRGGCDVARHIDSDMTSTDSNTIDWEHCPAAPLHAITVNRSCTVDATKLPRRVNIAIIQVSDYIECTIEMLRSKRIECKTP
jgi:hypothetical protein